MPKTKELSIDIQNKIIDFHKRSKGYRSIRKQFNVHPSTIDSIIRKWKKHHSTVNLSRMGAPKKISNRALNELTRMFQIILKLPKRNCHAN